MKIIVAPDSFKGSLSAIEAAEAIALGALSALPDAEVIKLPLADGGEGTVDALVSATGGQLFTKRVMGPMGDEVEATYGIMGGGETAVIEMSVAAGLGLVPPNQRNPLIATTYGVGQLIEAALKHNVKKIVIGVGGSATNDGGAGAVQALGARLLDSDGVDLPPGGAALLKLDSIDLSGFRFPKGQVEVLVACDVDNPLIGSNGASAVYGPQKGATLEMVEILEAALSKYAQVIHKYLDIDVAALPAGGAAGGLAAGLAAFLDAKLQPGIEIVLDAVKFDEKAHSADLVITGEGRIDYQTLRGKTIAGVARRCALMGIPMVALAGSVGDGFDKLYSEGLTAVFSIMDRPMSEEEAMRDAYDLLRKTARDVVALLSRNHEKGKCE